MKRILLVDNYDSFTYNLVHLIEKIAPVAVDVVLNDKIDFSLVDYYNAIVLSPGPGVPYEAGFLMPFISTFAPHKKILGVCLGHQAIAEVFGATLKNLDKVFHGVSTEITLLDNFGLFRDLDQNQQVGRYHSWVVERETLPNDLQVTATDNHGNIMGLRHKQYNIQGVQFHPESIMTSNGEKMMSNWLSV
jgi:anthranilate synthase component 2